MNAFSNMAPTSTLQRYVWLILNEWWNTADSGLCSGKSNACKGTTLDGVMHIFRRRGLLSLRTDISDFDIPSTNAAIKFDPSKAISSNAGALKFIPYPGSGKSNSDEILDPCETVLVVPNLTNTSSNYTVNGKSYAVDWVDGLLRMTSFSGFSSTNYETNLTSTSNTKMLPWLSPGDSVYDLVKNTSSRLYDISSGGGNGSSMIKALDSDHQTSIVGWVLKAPASGSVSVTIQLTQIRPYNASTNLWKSTSFTQTTTVNTSSGHSFCGQ
jgi:hypothetical protein